VRRISERQATRLTFQSLPGFQRSATQSANSLAAQYTQSDPASELLGYDKSKFCPTMILEAGCAMTVEAADNSAVVLMLQPQSGFGQEVKTSYLSIEPHTEVREVQDAFGNFLQRTVLHPGKSVITSTCTVETPDEIAVDPGANFTLIQNLPDDVVQYLLPSRYCESDKMLKLATSIAKGSAPGYPQVEAIRSWIFRKLRYKYGVSNASTSAMETARKRAGVCRDFSHLGIALCRALRVPARVVVGYLYQLDPMDLHAWFEAFVGNRWYTFDATQKTPRGNRIVIAYGRDAADVAQMSEYGPVKTKSMSVWVKPATASVSVPA
jgi:transglutaminase-like putative cysteine protease